MVLGRGYEDRFESLPDDKTLSEWLTCSSRVETALSHLAKPLLDSDDPMIGIPHEDSSVPAPVVVTELLAAVRGTSANAAGLRLRHLCIALGIGATSAISSAISRALLQPLPFREPERLVTVYRTTPHFDTGPFSPANYADLARETRQLEALAAMTPTTELLQLTTRRRRSA